MSKRPFNIEMRAKRSPLLEREEILQLGVVQPKKLDPKIVPELIIERETANIF